jgi:hypothetical protein
MVHHALTDAAREEFDQLASVATAGDDQIRRYLLGPLQQHFTRPADGEDHPMADAGGGERGTPALLELLPNQSFPVLPLANARGTACTGEVRRQLVCVHSNHLCVHAGRQPDRPVEGACRAN